MYSLNKKSMSVKMGLFIENVYPVVPPTLVFFRNRDGGGRCKRVCDLKCRGIVHLLQPGYKSNVSRERVIPADYSSVMEFVYALRTRIPSAGEISQNPALSYMFDYARAFELHYNFIYSIPWRYHVLVSFPIETDLELSTLRLKEDVFSYFLTKFFHSHSIYVWTAAVVPPQSDEPPDDETTLFGYPVGSRLCFRFLTLSLTDSETQFYGETVDEFRECVIKHWADAVGFDESSTYRLHPRSDELVPTVQSIPEDDIPFYIDFVYADVRRTNRFVVEKELDLYTVFGVSEVVSKGFSLLKSTKILPDGF
jgi:hypothetical protein